MSLPAIDVAAEARRLADDFDGLIGIVVVREEGPGQDAIDMSTPRFGDVLEKMAAALLQQTVNVSRLGAADCPGCAARLERVIAALADLDPALSFEVDAPLGGRVH